LNTVPAEKALIFSSSLSLILQTPHWFHEFMSWMWKIYPEMNFEHFNPMNGIWLQPFLLSVTDGEENETASQQTLKEIFG
jgi:hypothetical protein